MYQKPYTCTKINVLLHFSDLRAIILQYNNLRGPIFPEIQKLFNLRKRSQSWHTILLLISNSLYLCEFNRYLGLWSLWLQMTSLKLLSVKYFWICSIKVIILYNTRIVLMSSYSTSHTVLSFMYITCSAGQFNQIWCWDVDQMLYFTLKKHKKC